MLEEKKTCLAIDLGRTKLRLLFLRKKKGRLHIDYCKSIDINHEADLSDLLEQVVIKMLKTVKCQEGSSVACAISSESFYQCELELPADMEQCDVEAYLRLSASNYLSDEEAKWICDFQLQPVSGVDCKQAIKLYAITEEIISYYLDLMRPLPWRFSILEPDFSSLWRGFTKLVTTRKRVALLLQEEERICFLSGEEGCLDLAYAKEHEADSPLRSSEIITELLAEVPLELARQVKTVYLTDMISMEPLVAHFLPSASRQLLQCSLPRLSSEFLLAFGLGLRGVA